MSQCQGHVAAATQWDALWGQTPGVTVHWSVCNHCVSHIQHQLCLSGTWNPDSNLLYLYYLTVTEIGMLECCILNTILWLSQQNQVNRLCLCMWQRGVWTSQVKCAAGTSSRMIYFISLIYACLSCLQSACSGPSRLFCLTPDHWLHLCPGASGGSDQWPHTGTSGT